MEEESDPPQTELVSEVTNILDTLQVLNNHLRKAESFHKKLNGNKGKLEYDLGVKQNSIQIDSNLLFNREVSSSHVVRSHYVLYSRFTSDSLRPSLEMVFSIVLGLNINQGIH